jgi:hypothetical protein
MYQDWRPSFDEYDSERAMLSNIRVILWRIYSHVQGAIEGSGWTHLNLDGESGKPLVESIEVYNEFARKYAKEV